MKLSGKRVLITGADGFIGSHLTEALLGAGCDVRAFVFYNSFNSWGWLDTLPKAVLNEVDVVAGDVRDPHGVRAALKGIDVAMHLAALIGIPFSYHSPDSYVDTNIKGTLNMLQSCRDLGTERLVVTSTSEVYGTAQSVPMDESHPLQGQSPYSATKIAADKLAESFWRSFDLPVTTARPFNTYGPRQSARAIIPTIITQLLHDPAALQLGSLHPTRDLTFVADTCAAFLALAGCDAAVGRTVNIGSGMETSVRELASLLMEVTGCDAPVHSEGERERPRASEVERLLADTSLIRELTGWEPAVGLREGLERTVAWFREPQNLQKYRAEIYNV